MHYRTVLGLRFGVALAVLAIVCIFFGWLAMWYLSMPVAFLCSLGAPASRRTKTLFLVGWVVYLAGVIWVVNATYGQMHRNEIRRRL